MQSDQNPVASLIFWLTLRPSFGMVVIVAVAIDVQVAGRSYDHHPSLL
jgi:hypothetical protein